MTAENETGGSSFAAILTVLDIVCEQMNDIAKDVEISVLGVCNGFQGMSTRARSALSKAADALDTKGDDGGLPAFIHRVRMALATLICRLESSRDLSLTLANQVQEVDERLSLVIRLGEKLVTIAEDSRTSVSHSLGTLRRVPAGRAAADNVLEQVQVITQATSQCGQAICSLVSGLRSITKDNANRARNCAEEDQQTLTNSETVIRNTLELMGASYEKMNESLSSSAAMNRQLNNDIGQAVMSMQFQDRVNQRIEHIVTTIEELASDLRPLCRNRDPEVVHQITKLWTDRLAEKSTMEAERRGGSASEAAEESSIDLF